MPNNFLLPETKVEANGTGPALELGAAGARSLLLTLGITKILEQQSLDVSVWGSADGADWGAQPLLAFPQKFYTGTCAMILDLSARPEIRCLRTQWKAARWGVGSTTPMFVFYVFAEPLSQARTA